MTEHGSTTYEHWVTGWSVYAHQLIYMGDWFPYANGFNAFNKQKIDDGMKERKGKEGRETKHIQHSYNTRLTPWSTILLQNPRVLRLVKKFPTLYENWRFITMFTRVHHLSLPQPINLVHTQPRFFKTNFNIILQSTPKPFKSYFPPHVFPSKPASPYAPLQATSCCAFSTKYTQ